MNDAASRRPATPQRAEVHAPGGLLGLPRAFASRLLEKATTVILEEGQVLCERGDPGDGCYWLQQGVLKVVLRSPTGEQRIVAVLGTGAVVGEMAMIDGLARSATVIAMRLCRLSFVHRNVFLEALKREPHINEYLVATLARRLRHADDEAAAASFLSVPARVARAVLQLAEHLGERSAGDDDQVVVRHNLRQSDLAALAGVARESVSRTISRWRKADVLAMPDRTTYRFSRAKMQAEAQTHEA